MTGWNRWLTSLTLILATALVISLSFQVRAARGEIADLRVRSLVMPVGTLSPILTAETLTGEPIELGPSPSAAQLYFVYNETCTFCVQSIVAWNSLADRFDASDSVRVVGIVLAVESDAGEYHSRNGLRFPGVALTDARSRDSFRFRIVPQTLVLDGDGRIVVSRPGVLSTGPATDSIIQSVEWLLANAGSGSMMPQDNEVRSVP